MLIGILIGVRFQNPNGCNIPSNVKRNVQNSAPILSQQQEALKNDFTQSHVAEIAALKLYALTSKHTNRKEKLNKKEKTPYYASYIKQRHKRQTFIRKYYNQLFTLFLWAFFVWLILIGCEKNHPINTMLFCVGVIAIGFLFASKCSREIDEATRNEQQVLENNVGRTQNRELSRNVGKTTEIKERVPLRQQQNMEWGGVFILSLQLIKLTHRLFATSFLNTFQLEYSFRKKRFAKKYSFQNHRKKTIHDISPIGME